MKIQLSGKNITITPAIETHVNEKFQPLSKHFNNLDHIHIVVTVDNHLQKAEATTHLYHTDIHASASHPDLYTAINELAHKLDKQLTTHKEKVIDNHR